MDAERLLGLVEAAFRQVGARWAVIGGMAMNAYGHARTTLDFDIAAEERVLATSATVPISSTC